MMMMMTHLIPNASHPVQFTKDGFLHVTSRFISATTSAGSLKIKFHKIVLKRVCNHLFTNDLATTIWIQQYANNSNTLSLANTSTHKNLNWWKKIHKRTYVPRTQPVLCRTWQWAWPGRPDTELLSHWAPDQTDPLPARLPSHTCSCCRTVHKNSARDRKSDGRKKATVL